MIFQNFLQKPLTGVLSGASAQVHVNPFGHFIALAPNAGESRNPFLLRA
ncbi:hypothetical protein ACFS5N_08880 [Mucilaginibacter ximonensis]|uniref:Uncharacterized protein n=1 Tax=Mucilaginibacter ximonensis TaxID=538021 RepID=A0ABW5YB21_9SPHI